MAQLGLVLGHAPGRRRIEAQPSMFDAYQHGTSGILRTGQTPRFLLPPV